MNIFSKLFNRSKNQNRRYTPIVDLDSKTIKAIKHGHICKVCGQKFYPKKLELDIETTNTDEIYIKIKPYNVCYKCDQPKTAYKNEIPSRR